MNAQRSGRGALSPLAIIVFARRPRTGRVKRRLARTVGARRAARRYAALLERMLRHVEAQPRALRSLWCADARDQRWFRRRLRRRGWRVQVQCRGDLGRRMAHALRRPLDAGCPALLVGSDIVDATRADFAAARAALAGGADLVLGPVADGGYWLIGLRRTHDELFRAIAWSGSDVARATRARAAQSGLRSVLLPLRHDLDRGADRLRAPRAHGGRDALASSVARNRASTRSAAGSSN